MSWALFTGPLVFIAIGCLAAVGAGCVAIIGRRFQNRAIKISHFVLSVVAVAGICLSAPLWIMATGLAGIVGGERIIDTFLSPITLGLFLSLVPSVFIVIPLIEIFTYQRQRFDLSLSEEERFWRPYGI